MLTSFSLVCACCAAAGIVVRWITATAKALAEHQNLAAREQLVIAQTARKSYENTLRYGMFVFYTLFAVNDFAQLW